MGLAQPLKWWGGKQCMAKQVIALVPRHLHYVEPHAVGVGVLLEKDPLDASDGKVKLEMIEAVWMNF